MRIFNGDNKKVYNGIEIYLTPEEAEDFYFRLNDLANNPKIRDDVIMSESVEDEKGDLKCKKIIFIGLYNLNDLSQFSERAKEVILKDK